MWSVVVVPPPVHVANWKFLSFLASLDLALRHADQRRRDPFAFVFLFHWVGLLTSSSSRMHSEYALSVRAVGSDGGAEENNKRKERVFCCRSAASLCVLCVCPTPNVVVVVFIRQHFCLAFPSPLFCICNICMMQEPEGRVGRDMQG